MVRITVLVMVMVRVRVGEYINWLVDAAHSTRYACTGFALRTSCLDLSFLLFYCLGFSSLYL